MTPLGLALDGGVLTLTLDRPDRRNALSPDLVRALLDALGRARADPAVRAVLLQAAPPAFCAGGDFDAMRARRGDALATKRAQDEGFAALAKAILHLEKPVVACVEGDAFGAGMMLVLASDYAVASPKARFAATFARVGLVPDTAGTWLLPKTLGLRDARRLALIPDPVDAKEAEELTIVNEVADDARGRAAEVARRWASMPTLALGAAKRAIVEGTSSDLETALGREAALQGIMFTTRDHAEGVDAFLEKRDPRFEGR
ncbi:MAG TPA: enoyl-CoA hydratase-related protein [Candidatus Thermoplasmatota archaeon]|nr:enoyl-CoA hydratase-related protein [Candidatus Thermoplasmatota archaeon]